MATNAVFDIVCLIGIQYLILTDGVTHELAATKNSIYASITPDEFEKLNTTLMDVVKTTSVFREAYHETEPKRNAVIEKGRGYGLTEEETLSVMMYTAESVYKDFNTILREGDMAKYDKSFQVFHYLLINAIEKIRLKQTLPELLYRGVRNTYSIENGTEMRFPSFTSTSADIKVANGFRGVSGTLIKLEGVKLGADIKEFSIIPSEAEVLIPPYERFKVINVDTYDIVLRSIEEKCGGRRRRSMGGPCRCCRLPLDEIRAIANGGVPQRMKLNVVYFYVLMYVVVSWY